MIRPPKTKTTAILTTVLAVATACTVAQASPVTGALGETKPIIDLRLRHEHVDQDPLAANADAMLFRARLGAETGKAWNTALLVEGDFVTPLIDNYRDDTAVNTNTAYPVVPDPEAYEVNRFQLTNTSIANTTITLGRQRINLDDQRFIGNVGWRMNEQTYDSLRVVNKPLGGRLTLDVTYANRVNRIFGADSPQGAYKGDVILGNAAYQFKIGKLTVFNYLLDFDPLNIPGFAALNPARVSSNTLGARFTGETPLSRIRLGYVASYATQKDHGDNPLVTAANPKAMDNDYFLGELSVTYRALSIGVGNEILQGNGTAGFATPLATLHKFQGWADKFLTTPVNGIDDRYGSIAYTLKGVGPLDTLAFAGAYHDYESERLNQSYGSELNGQIQAKWRRFTGTLKYADYRQSNSAYRDTQKGWAQLEFVW